MQGWPKRVASPKTRATGDETARQQGDRKRTTARAPRQREVEELRGSSLLRGRLKPREDARDRRRSPPADLHPVQSASRRQDARGSHASHPSAGIADFRRSAPALPCIRADQGLSGWFEPSREDQGGRKSLRGAGEPRHADRSHSVLASLLSDLNEGYSATSATRHGHDASCPEGRMPLGGTRSHPLDARRARPGAARPVLLQDSRSEAAWQGGGLILMLEDRTARSWG